MEDNSKDGILLVDKPGGITSHDVVDCVRKKLGTKHVGHAGTLDPLADGLLIILVGKYTKLFSKFVNFDKEYLGILKLGEVTTTGDSEGQIIKKSDTSTIDADAITNAFSKFSGEISQVPPMVSALRIKGRRLYNLARRGITVDRPARKITIHSLRIIKIDIPFVEFYVKCSKGTYIRKLAEDIGELLGCGAHIVKIQRLSVGPFKLEEALNLEKIDAGCLRKIAL